MNVPGDEAGTVTGMNSEDKQAWPDLAGRALGGSVIYANDELFAERENLIKPEEPVFRPHTFGHKGQIMDGWETRRRREPGSDAAIIRLGCGGVVRRVVVDTSYFTGNYPPRCRSRRAERRAIPPRPTWPRHWATLVPRSPVAGDARNEFEVSRGSGPRTFGSPCSPTAGWPGSGSTASRYPTPGCCPPPSTWPRWRTAPS
jgi:Allantoicase